MSDTEWLTSQFEEHRPRLRAVAYRMLGSAGEADDAVQETWLRLAGSDAGTIDNLGGWLTTVMARVCLNVLQSRRRRAEQPLDARRVEPATDPEHGPEAQAEQADAVGAALLVVLDTLAPAERLAFVLHDMFGVPFDEIAPIVDRTPAAARQLASRARRRVRGGGPAEPDQARRRRVVHAFLTAAQEGDFAALLKVLDPDIVLRADPAAVALANHTDGGFVLRDEIRGRSAVAQVFAGRAAAARPAMIDGVPGAAWEHDGRVRSVFTMTFDQGRITAIEVVNNQARLRRLNVEML